MCPVKPLEVTLSALTRFKLTVYIGGDLFNEACYLDVWLNCKNK